VTAQPATARTFWDVPAVAPDAAWREKRRLAAALRELATLCVTTDAPETTLSYAADAVERIAERLAQHPQRTFKQGMASCKSPDDLARFADRGTLTGLCNPYSPPMELSMEGERAIARVTFGPPFEGIPGHVHGGLVAAAFDQLFGYMQVKLGAGSVTGELTVRYLLPTPLLRSLHLEARVVSAEGRRSVVAAKMLSGEHVTAEADGIFIRLDAARLHGMIASSGPSETSEG
jgi:acyl-coenzyme A thioesterase PaaI-like protein